VDKCKNSSQVKLECERLNFEIRPGDEGEKSELPALEQLVAMGYEYKTQSELIKERRKKTEVLLYDRIKSARINPLIVVP